MIEQTHGEEETFGECIQRPSKIGEPAPIFNALEIMEKKTLNTPSVGQIKPQKAG